MAQITVENLLNAFPEELSLLTGNKSAQITHPASQEAPEKLSIVYVNNMESAQLAVKNAVSCLVIPAKAKGLLSQLTTGETAVLAAEDTKLMMAKVNQRFFPVLEKVQSFDEKKIHPTAVIHPTAELHESVCVGPNTVIYDSVKIGEGTKISANCSIEAKSTLGKDCRIHPNVVICHDTQIGNRVEIKANSTIGGEGFGYAKDKDSNFHRIPHYGNLIIEDDVEIGGNVSIDRGTFEPSRIGRNTKIDNHCHLGHNIEIGENCLLTAGFISAGSAKIRDNCTFAGRSSINGHIEICSDVTIGPLSAVTNDVREPGVYSGFPIIPFKDFLKVQASLASLPRLRKDVAMLLKKLGLQDNTKS